MIRLNLMEAALEANNPKATTSKKLKPQTVKATSLASTQSAPRAPRRRHPLALAAYILFFALAGALSWLLLMGVPQPLRGVIPPQVLAALGVESSTEVVPVQTVETEEPPSSEPAEPPQVVAQDEPAPRPAVPVNGAVEEIVKTLRPELFVTPARAVYHELLPTEKILYQQQAFQQLLATLYSITPEKLGYLDLAFKAPDCYYLRGLSTDSLARADFLARLKSSSREFKLVPASAGAPANEFTAYGTMLMSQAPRQASLQLVAKESLNREVLALRDLALSASVRFNGLENPVTDSYGAYRRTLLRTTTRADYPSLLRFAETLRGSALRVGVLQFTSRPTADGGMSSAVDFVIYSAP